MSKTLELSVEEDVFAQLEKLANEHGYSLQTVAQEALRRYVQDESQQKMQREIAAFRAMHADLLQRYEGQHVAVYQGNMVDHDPDLLALYLRIDQKYPDDVVLIRQVRPEVERILHIRSPRLERG